MSDNLQLKILDGVATVTLNRPEQRNAMNYGMWKGIVDICEQLERDSDVRVVLITGAGSDAFSAGADIKEFEELRSNSSQGRDWGQVLDTAMSSLANLSKPTISVIKGYCIGGGCELACFTDLRIATDNSSFGIPAARLSIALGYYETRRIVQLIGPGNLSYMLMSARLLSAPEALRIGLVNEVLPKEEIDAYVSKLTQDIIRLAPISHRNNKSIIRTVLNNPTLEGLTDEQEVLPFEGFDSNDYREGRLAFVEKRHPVFKGI